MFHIILKPARSIWRAVPEHFVQAIHMASMGEPNLLMLHGFRAVNELISYRAIETVLSLYKGWQGSNRPQTARL
jgi:hypothetical protein